jgi:hypothetical protein
VNGPWKGEHAIVQRVGFKANRRYRIGNKRLPYQFGGHGMADFSLDKFYRMAVITLKNEIIRICTVAKLYLEHLQGINPLPREILDPNKTFKDIEVNIKVYGFESLKTKFLVIRLTMPDSFSYKKYFWYEDRNGNTDYGRLRSKQNNDDKFFIILHQPGETWFTIKSSYGRYMFIARKSNAGTNKSVWDPIDWGIKYKAWKPETPRYEDADRDAFYPLFKLNRRSEIEFNEFKYEDFFADLSDLDIALFRRSSDKNVAFVTRSQDEFSPKYSEFLQTNDAI